MQLVATKTLPPLSPSLVAIIEKQQKDGQGKVALELGLSYCPAMDLVATYPVIVQNAQENQDKRTAHEGNQTDEYDDDDNAIIVTVWRFNGQKVFEVEIESEDGGSVDIVDVDWRDDGLVLAILSSDNTVRLVNSFNGKTVHRYPSKSTYPVPQSPKSTRSLQQSGGPPLRTKASNLETRPSTISFFTNFVSSSTTSSQLKTAHQETGIIIDDLLGLHADINRLLKSKADLPRELAGIDVETYLPKLACLPQAGFGAEDVFSVRASMDAIFHSSQKTLRSGTLNVLMAGTDHGVVHLRIIDSFEIGDIDLTAAAGLPVGVHCRHVLQIASHPFSNEVFILVGCSQIGEPDQVHLLSLNLKFITQSSIFLPVLIAKATQLHNLLRYLIQIQSQLAKEVKTAFDLPTRFLNNLNEDLVNQDGEGSTFAAATHHAIVIGEISGALKEWLADQLGERGVKRWEKAVGDCLELVRRLTSECWNPAVERSSVVISRLTGLVAAGVPGVIDGSGLVVDKKILDSLKQTVDVMAICGEDLLREVNQELARFTAFVKWLKWQVEAAALEDTSERLDEMRENSDHGEVIKVLEYIESGPANTVVKSFVGAVGKIEAQPDHDDDADFYNAFKNQRNCSSQDVKKPTFDKLLSRLKGQCEELFKQVAHTLRKDIISEHQRRLPTQTNKDVMDIRVVPQAEYGRPKVHIIAQHVENKGTLSYVKSDSDAKAWKSQGNVLAAVTELQVPDAQRVLDVRFVDDFCFMVLAQTTDDIRIYSHGTLSADGESDNWQLRHVFTQGLMESGMRPRRLEINGRKGRRAVVVIDQDAKGYSVFDLDSDEGDVVEEVEEAEDDELMTD